VARSKAPKPFLRSVFIGVETQNDELSVYGTASFFV